MSKGSWVTLSNGQMVWVEDKEDVTEEVLSSLNNQIAEWVEKVNKAKEKKDADEKASD